MPFSEQSTGHKSYTHRMVTLWIENMRFDITTVLSAAWQGLDIVLKQYFSGCDRIYPISLVWWQDVLKWSLIWVSWQLKILSHQGGVMSALTVPHLQAPYQVSVMSYIISQLSNQQRTLILYTGSKTSLGCSRCQCFCQIMNSKHDATAKSTFS